MRRIGVYEQIKSFFQDIIAPVLHEIRGELHTAIDIRERLAALEARRA